VGAARRIVLALEPRVPVLLLQRCPDVGCVCGAGAGEGVGQTGDDLHRRLPAQVRRPLAGRVACPAVDGPSARQDVGVVCDADGAVRALHEQRAVLLGLVPPARGAQELRDVPDVTAACQGTGLDEIVLLGLLARSPALPLLLLHRRRRTTSGAGAGGFAALVAGRVPRCWRRSWCSSRSRLMSCSSLAARPKASHTSAGRAPRSASLLAKWLPVMTRGVTPPRTPWFGSRTRAMAGAASGGGS